MRFLTLALCSLVFLLTIACQSPVPDSAQSIQQAPVSVPTEIPNPSATPQQFSPTSNPSPAPTAIPTQTPTPTSKAVLTPVATAKPQPTPTPTVVPTWTPEPTATPTPTHEPTPVPTTTSVPTYTPQPTYTPLPTYTPIPSSTPYPTPTPFPTPTSVPLTATPSPTRMPPTLTPTPTLAPPADSGDWRYFGPECPDAYDNCVSFSTGTSFMSLDAYWDTNESFYDAPNIKFGCGARKQSAFTFDGGGPWIGLSESAINIRFEEYGPEQGTRLETAFGSDDLETVFFSERDDIQIYVLLEDADQQGKDLTMAVVGDYATVVANFDVTGFTTNFQRLPCS